MVLAMGLVFVLLLGEIDLSAGFTAGMGAAILGVTMTTHGWNWILSILAATPIAGAPRTRSSEIARATVLTSVHRSYTSCPGSRR